MYRGRPPPPGDYPPNYDGRGPPPRGPHPARQYSPFREDRGRHRAPFQQGYDHGPPEPYRRSPPRRRRPSPGSGSRGSDYWSGRPSRERSPSPRGGGPQDHSLVITVGNELTGSSGSGPPRKAVPSYDRSYPPRPGYDGPDDRGPRRRSPSRGRGLHRSHSRSGSPDRARAKSRGRSKSRPRSRSRSPDRARAQSRGRSKSRRRSPSHSPDRSRAKSRPRSKSRSRSRSRGCSYGRSVSRVRGRSVGRGRSRSVSTSSSSSSRSSASKKGVKKEFLELERARRLKEIEMLSMPTKSILKRRLDSEDSPSLMQSSDSPRVPGEGGGMSREAERFLTAMKGMEPNMLASLLGELRDDPQMAQRAGLNAELKGILDYLGGVAGQHAEKTKTDIDEEERFLYGDADESERLKTQTSTESSQPPYQSNLIQVAGGDLTDAALYGDYTQQHNVLDKTYGNVAAASSHLGSAALVDLTPRGSHQAAADGRYPSRASITSDQNITIEVCNPEYPPGTGPLDEKEQQDVEEYEKIQDLLKTIGLDLGVSDISKMAARTQERLHGKKPPPKTPTRRPDKRSRCDSSGSSDRGRRRSLSRSGSSDRSTSSSSSRSGSRGRSWSSDDGSRGRKSLPPADKHSSNVKSKSSRDSKTAESGWGPPAAEKTTPQTLDSNTIGPHPALAIPTYPQAHGIVPPNYPPPGYGQFGNYMPYMHQQWPPMYPPPSLGLPPQASHEDYLKPPSFEQPYLNVPQSDSDMKGSSNMALKDNGRSFSKASSHRDRCSDETNNQSEKQKVLEEREKLKQDRDVRMKKKEYLMKELERLRKQQGELLRKKRREKDGHKDPLLSEISRLQEEVMTQISDLRKEHETAEKKRSEIDKVALILGLNPSDKPQKVRRISDDYEQPPAVGTKKPDRSRIPASSLDPSSTIIKAKSAASTPRISPEKSKTPARVLPPLDPFEYYDAGNHWCKNCNITSGSMFDFFTHLHSKSHRKTQDPYDRPWVQDPSQKVKTSSAGDKMAKPAKGSEFLVPVRGFFCLLCEEFYGDAICGEEHVTTHTHNEKYKKQIYEHPLYEQRRNLDRQAGITLEVTGKKRKHGEGDGEKEEKSKNPKKEHTEKKEEVKTTENKEPEKKEDKLKPKKDTEEKPRLIKKEESTKRDGEERYVYNKKDIDGNYKYSKRDEGRSKYSTERDERSKHSKKDDEDRYKYSREEEDWHKYRREEDERSRFSREEDRSKRSWRDDDDDEEERYRYSKGKESRSRHDGKEEDRYKSDRDEGKYKNEKDDKQFKKGSASRPKEESKPAPKKLPEVPPRPIDASKIMCGPSPAMRAKLRKKSEETVKGAVSNPPAFGKFTWKKKESELAKEAERVAAEFIKEDEKRAAEEPVDDDSFSKSMAVAKSIAIKLAGNNAFVSPWVPLNSGRGRIQPNLPPPAMVLRKTPGLLNKPAPLNTFLSIRPPNVSVGTPLPVTPSQPRKEDSLSTDIISKTFGGEEVVIKKKDDDSEPITVIEMQDSTTQSVMTMESDAPGVPASEQNRSILVIPPPFMNRSAGEMTPRPEKAKSNLAAAKAQDLFDIFYSGGAASSTVTKTITENKVEVAPKKNSEATIQPNKPKI
ncbi:zinc finger protein 318 [Aplochiton taeniatus]